MGASDSLLTEDIDGGVVEVKKIPRTDDKHIAALKERRTQHVACRLVLTLHLCCSSMHIMTKTETSTGESVS